MRMIRWMATVAAVAAASSLLVGRLAASADAPSEDKRQKVVAALPAATGCVVDDSKDIAKLKSFILRDDLSAALSLAKKHQDGKSSSHSPWGYNALKEADYQKRQNIDGRTPLWNRAFIATMAGLYDLAIRCYLRLVAETEQEVDRHRFAGLAALCAARKHDYGQAADLFLVMEQYELWVPGRCKEKAEQLREFARRVDDVSARIAFAKDFWTGYTELYPRMYKEAAGLLIDTLPMKATRDQKLELYDLIIQYSLASSDPVTAEDYLRKFVQEFPESNRVLHSSFSLSQYYFSKDDLSRSKSWLQWIVETGGGDPSVAKAHLGLSEVYQKLKREVDMLDELKKAAQFQSAAPTQRGIMDTMDTKQEATVRLGHYYKSKGEFKQAISYYQSWQPGSWCGTCLESMQYEKVLYISECLVGMGETDKALDEYIMPRIRGEGAMGLKLAEMALSIHERRGQMYKFIRELRPYLGRTRSDNAKFVLDIAEIRLLAHQGRADQLADMVDPSNLSIMQRLDMDQSPGNDCRIVAAVKALAGMGEAGFLAAKRKFEASRDDKTPQSPYGLNQREALLCVMALTKSLKAEDYLQNLLNSAADAGANKARVTKDEIRQAMRWAQEASLSTTGR